MNFELTRNASGLMVGRGSQVSSCPSGFEEVGNAQLVFRLRRILVPVDFSECSKQALEYALALAEHFGAELTLLHVAPRIPPVPEFGPVDEVAVREARKELEALRVRVSAVLPSHTVLSALWAGEPHVEIVRAAEERAIDLIVLSTHGRTGLARILMGSTAEKVVRHAKCPVLIVRQRKHEFVDSDAPENRAGSRAR